MDKTDNTTTRETIVGAAASVSAISSAQGAAYRSGAKSVDQLLVELVDRFKLDAMAIDPTITGLWLYRDLTMPERNPAGAVHGLFLERAHASLRASERKAGA